LMFAAGSGLALSAIFPKPEMHVKAAHVVYGPDRESTRLR
jgi:hypothetical protein